MGLLVNQFDDACRRWSERTGDLGSLIHWIMLFTGGMAFFKRSDATDPAAAGSEEESLQRAWSDAHHLPSIDEVKVWLETLTERVYWDEAFLIASLVRGIERELENLADPSEYDQGVRRRREYAEFIEEIAADPNHPDAEAVRNLGMTEGELQQELEFVRRSRLFRRDDAEQDRHEQMLDIWREVTSPIMNGANLQRGRHEQHERWLSRGSK